MAKSKRKREKLGESAIKLLREKLKIDEEPDRNLSLTELRKISFAQLQRGTEGHHTCPACQAHVAVYARTIAKNIAFLLGEWYRRWPDKEWHKLNDLLTPELLQIPGVKKVARGGDFAKLEYWKIIEEQKLTGKKCKRSGIYRFTDRGINFVTRKVKLSRTVFIFRNDPLGFGTDLASFDDALETPFILEDVVGE